MSNKCKIENCNSKCNAHGYCGKHYQRIRRHGNLNYQSRREPIFGSIRERFMKSFKINKETRCWEWFMNFTKQGYAQFQYNNKYGKRITIRGNRLSYKLFNGNIHKGLHVLHSCDNVKCVSPYHLWLGTRSDNMKDCCNKGRHPTAIKGQRPKPFEHQNLENHPSAKLTNKEVIIIKRKLNKGILGKDLAKEFKVTEQLISAIKVGRLWKDI